jgi:hypothetical protein
MARPRQFENRAGSQETNMKRAAISGALSFCVMHILLVTTPVLLSHATGETQGWLTYFADFPLFVGMLSLGFLDDRTSYLVLVCVLGPLMYAAIGALIGSAVGKILGAKKLPRN